MKVLAVIIVSLAVGSAARSGPYLPSGWKPSGPAFYLPGEVQKTADNPLKDTLQVEAEGSDFLREYGPPTIQEVSQDLTKQELPDVITEQTFAIIDLKTKQEVIEAVAETTTELVTEAEVKSDIVVAVTEQKSNIVKAVTEEKSDIVEAVTEEKSDIVEVVTEEKSDIVEAVTEEKSDIVEAVTKDKSDIVGAVTEEKSDIAKAVTEEKSYIVEAVTEGDVVTELAFTTVEVADPIEIRANTEAADDVTEKQIAEVVESVVSADFVQENENANSDIVSSVEERQGKSVDAEEEVVEIKEEVQGVQNIAEALTNLENEIKAQQVPSVESVAEVKTAEENVGSLEQVPEGFLEYGPPGFREYGPPKEALTSEDVTEQEAVESNETRRRRFSPKFRSTGRAHH